MEIRQLKVFIAVCEEMSFSKAAKKLAYAQSTVSDNIQALEKILNCKLFERLGKKIYLTGEGEVLREEAIKLIEHYEKVLDIMTDKKDEVIRLGITETLCSYKFPDFFRSFLTENEGVKISFEIKRDDEILDMIRNNMIDIGFVFNEDKEYKDIKTIELFDEEVVFIDSKVSNDLNGKNIIIPEVNIAYMKYFHDHYEKMKINKGTVIYLENIEGIKNYVKNGFGISFVPLTTIQKELKEGELFVVRQNRRFVDKVKILVHKDKQISGGLSRLIESTKRLV